MDARALIRVLLWADLLAVYAMWVMMTYLTEVWELSITHAAGILNIWNGSVFFLVIVLAYIVDSFFGNYPVLAFSSIAYSIGLGLLSMSTPPILSNFTGTCSKYKSKCIGHAQKVLFYTALPLIAIGMSGHIVSSKEFILEQGGSKVTQGLRKGEIPLALFAVVGAIALPYIKPWSIRFGIPAICTLVATILFLIGSRWYRKEGPKGSPITNIFRVIIASASKIAQQLPSNPNELYEEEKNQEKLRRTGGLRCLDKAAIKLRNQEENKWRLCTVAEVEETKIAIRMIPMWMTFIICGLVSSAGSTYFQEQANQLNRKVGSLKVPLTILKLLQDAAKWIFNQVYQCLTKLLDNVGLRNYAPSVGIAGAMIFASLSCITAAKVEARRLHTISHNLFETLEGTIPMNIFWILPQFVLLAGLDSFFEKGVSDFFRDQYPASMAEYLDHFSRCVSGFGYMASVVSVYVVGKISERGGKPNWFQDTLNKSRFDKYFWILAAMCAVNFVVYLVLACMYRYKEPSAGGEAEQDDGQHRYEETSKSRDDEYD